MNRLMKNPVFVSFLGLCALFMIYTNIIEPLMGKKSKIRTSVPVEKVPLDASRERVTALAVNSIEPVGMIPKGLEGQRGIIRGKRSKNVDSVLTLWQHSPDSLSLLRDPFRAHKFHNLKNRNPADWEQLIDHQGAETVALGSLAVMQEINYFARVEGPHGKFLLVEGNTLGEGDPFAGMKINSIQKNKMILHSENQQKEILIKKERDK